jgi:hypothetical protein
MRVTNKSRHHPATAKMPAKINPEIGSVELNSVIAMLARTPTGLNPSSRNGHSIYSDNSFRQLTRKC